MERVYRVRTPEMVEFTFPVAGLGSRFLAWLVDGLMLLLLLAAIWLVALLAGVALVPGLGAAGLTSMASIALLVGFVVSWGYGVYFETAWGGTTPGKRLLGLRVIGEAGVRETFVQAGIRNLFRALDALPIGYVVGSVVHLASARGQRLGDLVAGTIVVREERRDVPEEIGFPEAKYNSFLEDEATATRIARAIAPAERELCLELLLRREELSLATRTALFADLAKHLGRRLELEKAAFLSDEKLVMNVAQVVVERERARAVVAG